MTNVTDVLLGEAQLCVEAEGAVAAFIPGAFVLFLFFFWWH